MRAMKSGVCLRFKREVFSATRRVITGTDMGIDSESDREANLQIGPTDKGMVRIYVESGGVEIPMDFSPDDADEIAQEIIAAAGRARSLAPGRGKKR
jgi:hypothetical protein